LSHIVKVCVLLFFSGFASLVYQILWMKQMSLVFGSTSHATGATLAAFFTGLAAGSWFWGRRSSITTKPMAIYGWLEVGIAITALLYFLIINLYHSLYPMIYQNIESHAVLLVIKFALALFLIFPPAFCMGGTIPVMGQFFIQNPNSFGTRSAMLYGINTLGAALGATMAGFYFPLWFGFNGTCITAMAITMIVALIALKDSTKVKQFDANIENSDKNKAETHRSTIENLAIYGLCILSGFGILSLEVLWTRMFAQVLENSIYTFAAILVVVLLCLSLGAFLSSQLAKINSSPLYILAFLTLLSGISIALTPAIFMEVTDSLKIIALKGTWLEYMILIFKKTFITVGPPALILGTIFPYLMKVEESVSRSAGLSLGRLGAINTLGAIFGSLICGFIFLENFGMWRTMQIIALVYLLFSLLIPLAWDTKGLLIKSMGFICLLLTLFKMDPASLPTTSIDSNREHEEVLETYEGSDCTVAVTQNNSGLNIKINSHYGLGGTGAYMQEKLQTDIPLLVYPKTESVFFLGMGSGITAGSALDPQFKNIKSIITCELVPEVITAAKKYVTNYKGFDFTNGLFKDKRSIVLPEDGRHYLMASKNKFDLINSDLFIPYRVGASDLYSKDHFISVKKRLNKNGVFFQWIPLYQVTEDEFGIITNTMLEVFKHVTLWRNNFQPGQEVVALVGHKDGTPLPACELDSSEDKAYAVRGKSYFDLQQLSLPFNNQTITFFYCGYVSAARSLFAHYPINSDDKPMIEYLAPRTYRNKGMETYPWFIGPKITQLVDKILKICPPDKDPMLINRNKTNKRMPLAGAAFHRARVAEVIRDEKMCSKAWFEFLGAWLDK